MLLKSKIVTRRGARRALQTQNNYIYFDMSIYRVECPIPCTLDLCLISKIVNFQFGFYIKVTCAFLY